MWGYYWIYIQYHHTVWCLSATLMVTEMRLWFHTVHFCMNSGRKIHSFQHKSKQRAHWAPAKRSKLHWQKTKRPCCVLKSQISQWPITVLGGLGRCGRNGFCGFPFKILSHLERQEITHIPLPRNKINPNPSSFSLCPVVSTTNHFNYSGHRQGGTEYTRTLKGVVKINLIMN